MNHAPSLEETAADLAELRRHVATCLICRAARQRRRDSGERLRAWQRLCAESGDTDNTCPACIARSDQHLATGWDEICIRAAHPHTGHHATRTTGG